jgi:hypothetical protein
MNFTRMGKYPWSPIPRGGLGWGLKLSPRDDYSCESEAGEVVSSEAVVSGCDASPILQLAEHAFDDVSALIGGAIERDGVRLEAVEGMAALIFLCFSHRRRLSAL